MNRIHRNLTIFFIILLCFLIFLDIFLLGIEKNLMASFLGALVTIAAAYFIFISEQRANLTKKENESFNKLLNVLHELDYNLGPIYSYFDKFETFLEQMRIKIQATSWKEFKPELKQKKNFDNLVNDYMRLIDRYLLGIKFNSLSHKFIEDFVKEFDLIALQYRTKYGKNTVDKLNSFFLANFFTFDILRECTSSFSISFEQNKKEDAVFRKHITKLKHIYNVYFTNFRQIREVQPLEPISKFLFYNAVKCNMMYVHNFVEINYNLITWLIERYPELKVYVFEESNELDKLKRVLEKKEF